MFHVGTVCARVLREMFGPYSSGREFRGIVVVGELMCKGSQEHVQISLLCARVSRLVVVFVAMCKGFKEIAFHFFLSTCCVQGL